MNHNRAMLTLSRPFVRPRTSWSARWVTWVIWVGVGCSAVFWGLRLWSEPSAAAPSVGVAAVPVPDTAALAWLLGAASAVPEPVAAPTMPSRIVLLGVLAGRKSTTGVALLAIDGKPPKPYRVGAVVEPGLVLHSVGPREAKLGASRSAAPTVSLTLAIKK